MEKAKVVLFIEGNDLPENIKYLPELYHNQMHNRGEKNPSSKLTNEKVHKIRELAAQGKTGAEISRIFKISNGRILDVINRKGWKHI